VAELLSLSTAVAGGVYNSLITRVYFASASPFATSAKNTRIIAMSITFGAVGDIISVCLLVKDLVEALDKARGSKAEYQSAIRELWILEKTLLEIAKISKEHGDGSTPELRSLCETTKQAIKRCDTLVHAFLQRIRRCQTSLAEMAKPDVLHEATMKIRWRLGEKDELDKFRVEVAGIS
jgi:hypothetical protein